MKKYNKKTYYYEYCTGCELCRVALNVDFKKDKKGFLWPNKEQLDIEFCDIICPSAGNSYSDYSDIWGKYNTLYYGWASDELVRKKASSGGILTALSIYLLEKGLVSGIIQTKVSKSVVYETEAVISRSVEEVKACMGSRYSISAPLAKIKNLVRQDETYAFIGKPCDVAALRAYFTIDHELSRKIKYLLSFFCAGEPSEEAQRKLLQVLECSSPKDCIRLYYRGNGWPGKATAVKHDNSQRSISYNESWGKILGRDVRKFCRLCMDGIGESADIVCGDMWHLTIDNKPNFTEAEGRNVIFARTDIGEELLGQAFGEGSVILVKGELEQLKYAQPYQLTRRATMYSKLLALKIMGRHVPKYDSRKMKRLSKQVGFKLQSKNFLGTIKRVLNGKI